MHASLGDVDRTRHELRAVQRLPVGARDDRAGCRRSRMQSQREPLDRSEPSARAAEQLAEVIAGNVLHDLAARARAHAVRQHDRETDHEVAHRPEAMSQRPREVVDETFRERRIAGRVERQTLTVLGERRAQRRQANAALDDAREIARLVLDDLRTGRQARPSRAGGRGTAPAPRRKAAASGRASRDSRAPAGRTRGAAAASPRCRPRRT